MGTTRQSGIETKLMAMATTLANVIFPGSGTSSKTPAIMKEMAKAITQTYDSSKDPVVIAYCTATQATFGSDPINGIVGIPVGGSYTFTHALGFEPHVTMVHNGSAFWVSITSLTDTTVTIYSDHPSGSTLFLRIICS